MATVLSQHTSDLNSDRAFASLKRAFPAGRGQRRRPGRASKAPSAWAGWRAWKSRTLKRLLAQVKQREGATAWGPAAAQPARRARAA